MERLWIGSARRLALVATLCTAVAAGLSDTQVASAAAAGEWAVDLASTPSGSGYWITGRDGEVTNFGDAEHLGGLSGVSLNAPIVGMATTPSGRGYWLVASDGGVFAFGDAPFRGSAAGSAGRFVDIESSPTGAGYSMLRADGPVHRFGDAAPAGSLVISDAEPAVDFTYSASYRGAWITLDGGEIVPVGDSQGHGHLLFWTAFRRPLVSLARTTGGLGYWAAAADGGVFAFGDAEFHGSAVPFRPAGRIVDIEPFPAGPGYWLLGRDGGVFAFGAAPFAGSAPR